MKGSYPATVYVRPNGRKVETVIENIYEEDAEWFRQNEVILSLEDCGGFYAIFAECPNVVDMEDEPISMTRLAKDNDKCEDVIKKLREDLKKAIDNFRDFN